jgi:hypothetical protein
MPWVYIIPVAAFVIGWLLGRKQGFDEAAAIREAKVKTAYELGKCVGVTEVYQALGVEPPVDYD